MQIVYIDDFYSNLVKVEGLNPEISKKQLVKNLFLS